MLVKFTPKHSKAFDNFLETNPSSEDFSIQKNSLLYKLDNEDQIGNICSLGFTIAEINNRPLFLDFKGTIGNVTAFSTEHDDITAVMEVDGYVYVLFEVFDEHDLPAIISEFSACGYKLIQESELPESLRLTL